jgi:hypothetical protein
MAEKSIRIADAVSGDRIATRDAAALDASSNARVIERVDFASGKFASPIGNPVRGNSRTVSYTSGGTYQILVGDVITGATSGATARVIAITLTSGTWAGGDAAGVITVCDQVGTFQSENLNVGANSNVATIGANTAAVSLNAADTFDMTALPADLTKNLITVGDNSLLCVSVEQTVSGGTATIAPILYDNASTPTVVAVLPPKTFTQPYAFRRGSSSGNYVLPVLTWDISGAYKVGLHLDAISGTSNVVIFYGWMI